MKEKYIEFRYCWSNSKPSKFWKKWSEFVQHNTYEYKYLWKMYREVEDGVAKEWSTPEINFTFPDRNDPNLSENDRAYLLFHDVSKNNYKPW